MRALAAQRPAALASWLDTHQLTVDDVRWLHRQRLAVFAFHGFRQASLLARLPAEAAAALLECHRHAVGPGTAQDVETERVLQALLQAGVDFAWAKGGMLAYTVYPNPISRQRGDLDLWIQPEQAALAQSLLEQLGYARRTKAQRPPALAQLTGGELQMVRDRGGLRLVELQSPLIRGEWVRRTAAVDHAGMWQRRVPALLHGHVYPTLAPEDTLIHLCIHQAVNHQFVALWLRNLLDVHQVAARYDLDWAALAGRAAAWRVATVVWTALDLAQRLLDTAVPETAMQRLAPPAHRRRLIAQLHLDRSLLELRNIGDSQRRFLIQLLLVDRWQDAIRLLGRGAYPEAAWLRARYELEPERPIWRLRLAHFWLLATTARA
jgi:hypothetical protein